MMINVKLEGIPELKRALLHELDKVLDAAAEGMEIASNEIANHMAHGHPHRAPGAKVDDSGRSRNADGSLRFYDRTGQTVGSIRPMDVKRSGQDIETGVQVDSDQAVELEYGTSHARAFPYARPAIAEKRDDVGRIISNSIRRRIGT